MAAKLRSISRNQRFISACKGAFIFVLLLQFLGARSFVWGALYAACALIMYFRPMFNASALAPFIFAIVALPFAADISALWLRVAFAALFAAAFIVTLGVKNLTLTHRERWMHIVAYPLAYLSFLLFFVRVPSSVFLGAWAFALAVLACIIRVTIRDSRIAMPVLLLMGELLIAVAWLPIGPVASANLTLLAFLFIADTLCERRLHAFNIAAFIGVSGLIALTSAWRL